MRVTVLGKSPSWQDAGGACSGYLVQDGATSLLLDCGNGVFAKLRAQLDYLAVDAVVLSHLHADHFLDLVPFSYALSHGPRRDADAPVKPVLHAPPGARACFRQVAGGWGGEELVEHAEPVPAEHEPRHDEQHGEREADHAQRGDDQQHAENQRRGIELDGGEDGHVQ